MIDRQSPPEWQYYFNPWWRERRVYVTRFSKDECIRHLNETTTRFLGRRVGRAMLSAADYTLHRVTVYNNGFKPFACVTLDESQPETIVHVTLSSSIGARIFLTAYYGFLAFFAVAVLVAWPLLRDRTAVSADSDQLGQVLGQKLQDEPI